MHVPQSIQTRYELEYITIVPKQILSPAKSAPLIAVQQDSLVGAYLLTAPGVRISEKQLFDIMAFSRKFNVDLLPEPVEVINGEKFYDGHQLYSLVLPEISYKKGDVSIVNGVLESGRLGKGVLGTKDDGLVHNVYNLFGPESCREFLDSTQLLLTKWLMGYAFSIGLGDMMPNLPIQTAADFMIEKYLEKANELVDSAQQGVYKTDLSLKYRIESFEGEMLGVLAKLNDNLAKVQDRFMDNKRNQLNTAVVSGSKGVKQNITQIMTCIGQQNLRGKRVPKGFTDRTLPHYPKHDIGPAAGGFVRNSFIEGGTPAEFFFQAMGGRIGMIDTAIKTAESGYIQRRLMKAMEDLKVCYNGNVRNAANNIVQFVYGDEGFDTMHLEKQQLTLLKEDNKTLEEKYMIDVDDDKFLNLYMTADAVKRFKTQDKKRVQEEYERLVEYRHDLRYKYFTGLDVVDCTIRAPVNYWRMIPAAVYKFRATTKQRSDLTPVELIEMVDNLLEELSRFYKDPESSMTFLKILTRTMLSPKQCLTRWGLDKNIMEYLMTKIKEKVISSFSRPGEMVGPLSAQSIGEPSTQMSVHGEGEIAVLKVSKKSGTSEVYKGPVKPFIDELMKEHPESTFDTGYEDSHETILDLDENEYYIVGVNEKEETKFNKISHVSRHPANGNLMKITTRSGRSTVSTLSHSHLKRTVDSIVPVKGSDLKKGDRIPVARNIKLDLPPIKTVQIGKQIVELDELFGWFVGAYLSEGSIPKTSNLICITSIQEHFQGNTIAIAELFGKEARVRTKIGEYGLGIDTTFSHAELAQFLVKHCGQGSFNKKVPAFAYCAPEEFTSGLLRGYFDGDGNVQCDYVHNYIRACSRSEQLIKDLGLLYAYKGIFVNFTV